MPVSRPESLRRTSVVAAVMCVLFAGGGCYEPINDDSGDGNADGDADGGDCMPPDLDVAVTYDQDIAPILRDHCETCHRDEGIGPMPLSNYAQVAPWADSIALQTGALAMPPWPAFEDANCTPPGSWKGDSRLTDEEIELLATWADTCKVESNGEQATPLKPFPSLELENADKVVTIPVATTLPPLVEMVDGKNVVNADLFYCFVLDLDLATDEVMVASQVSPGNTKINHHALMYLVESGAPQEAVDQLDADDGTVDGRYLCTGGPGDGVAATLINAWVPGQEAFTIPHDAGMTVPAGSKVVLQVHYHPADESEVDDATSIALRFADSTPMRTAVLQLIGNDTTAASDGTGLQPGPNDPDPNNPEFLIPAGKADHSETMTYKVPAIPGGTTLRLAAVAGHMHFVGTKLTIELKDAASSNEDQCLVQLDWDFDWQRFYTYDLAFDELPEVKEGDYLRLRCAYNNTLENAALAEQLEIAKEVDEDGKLIPIDVKLGEGSLDEMCLGAYVLIVEP